MDPISAVSFAASIVGLLALTKPLIKQLGPSSHSKQELSRMVGVLIALRRSYESLREFLEFNDDDQSKMLELLGEPERQCMQAIAVLRKRLENRGFVDRLLLGSRWDGKFDKCIKILEDTRGLFDLAMQTDQ